MNQDFPTFNVLYYSLEENSVIMPNRDPKGFYKL